MQFNRSDRRKLKLPKNVQDQMRAQEFQIQFKRSVAQAVFNNAGLVALTALEEINPDAVKRAVENVKAAMIAENNKAFEKPLDGQIANGMLYRDGEWKFLLKFVSENKENPSQPNGTQEEKPQTENP